MTSVSFTFTPQDLGGRSVKGVSTGSALLLPTWDRHSAWQVPFASGIPALVDLGIEDTAPFFESATGTGYIDCAVDSAYNFWALSIDGRLIYRTAAGVSTVAASCVPTGQIPCKICVDTTGLLILAASGNVYHITSIAGAASPTSIGTFGAYASSFSYYAGNIYAAVASTQKLAIMTNPGGSVTTVTTPALFPAFVNASSNGIAVAGFNLATLAYNYVSLQSSPTAPSTLAAGILNGADTIQVITGNDPTWAVASSASTSGLPSAFAWVPNGEQILVSAGSSLVQVFNYAGTLTSSQTLTVTNAGALAVAPDSTIALVCQGSSNQVGVLVNTLGTWALGSPTTGITAPTSVVCTSSSAALVACSTGVKVLARLGSTWSVSSTVTFTGFTPSYLAYDAATGNTYCIGVNGSTGYIAYLTPANVATPYASWTGSADEVLVFSGRVLVLDKTNNLVRVFPSGPVNYSNGGASQSAYLTSATSISNLNNTIFVGNATEAVGMQFTAGVLTLGLLRSSVISVYNGSSFSTYNGPTIEDIPTAVQWSAAGNLFVTTSKNNFLQLTSAAALTSTTPLGEYTTQASGVPLGISSLLQFGSVWYATTSLSGVIVVISGVSG